jgi:nitrile hydratase beta subunit
MDGIHDLGGVEGFGPVPVKTGDARFRDLEGWEQRMWGLSSSPIAPGITIDWFRHGIERMVPSDYLSFAYFNKWCAIYFMFMLDNGTVDLEDIKRGHVKDPAPPAAAISLQQVLEMEAADDTNYERDTDIAPAFSVGDEIVTKARMTAKHTRLPRYARGVTGQVIAHHGAHLLPDKGAQGIEEAEHLYTVVFPTTELWGDQANPRDTVTLDLWESYLVPA